MKNKNLYKILLLLMTLNLLPSCNSLDLAPEDWYGSESYWQNETHVEGAMLGLHNDVRNKYEMLFFLGEARGGTSRIGTSSLTASILWSSPIKDNSFRVGSTGTGSWYSLYPNLLDVNLFIQNVEGGSEYLTDAQRSYYLGQAYGLRAYYYFWLYRTYGGVPLITTVKVLEGEVVAKELYTARSSAKETLNLIKDDINKSETFFGGDFTQEKSKAMWSLSATLVLKSEIYLWSAKVPTQDQTPDGGDAAVAKTALSQVIGKYSLQSDFKKTFSEKGNSEIIMTLRFIDGEATNAFGRWLSDPVTFINQVAGRNGNLITVDTLKQNGAGGSFTHEYKRGLFDSFDAEDKRRDITFLEFYQIREEDQTDWVQEDEYQGVLVHKNMGIVNSNNSRVFEGDMSVYRYADVLLLMAEIENKLGNSPSSYINEVRERAYGVDYDVAIHGHTNGSFAENEKAILFERDKEFVQEGKRWFDVVRMRDANNNSLAFDPSVNYIDSKEGEEEKLAIIDANKAYMLLWPVDASTLSKDPLLLQTEGYVE